MKKPKKKTPNPMWVQSLERFHKLAEKFRVMQKPAVGRIVHVYSSPMSDRKGAAPFGPEAAIIVGLHEEAGLVDLFVAQSNGTFHQNRVKYSPEPKAYCWTWPPRV